jgi:hypothetical protein
MEPWTVIVTVGLGVRVFDTFELRFNIVCAVEGTRKGTVLVQ